MKDLLGLHQATALADTFALPGLLFGLLPWVLCLSRAGRTTLRDPAYGSLLKGLTSLLPALVALQGFLAFLEIQLSQGAPQPPSIQLAGSLYVAALAALVTALGTFSLRVLLALAHAKPREQLETPPTLSFGRAWIVLLPALLLAVVMATQSVDLLPGVDHLRRTLPDGYPHPLRTVFDLAPISCIAAISVVAAILVGGSWRAAPVFGAMHLVAYWLIGLLGAWACIDVFSSVYEVMQPVPVNHLTIALALSATAGASFCYLLLALLGIRWVFLGLLHRTRTRNQPPPYPVKRGSRWTV